MRCFKLYRRTVLDSPIVIFIRKDLCKCSLHGADFIGSEIIWWTNTASACITGGYHWFRFPSYLHLPFTICHLSLLWDDVVYCLCWNSRCLPNENIEYWFNCSTNLYILYVFWRNTLDVSNYKIALSKIDKVADVLHLSLNKTIQKITHQFSDKNREMFIHPKVWIQFDHDSVIP